MSTTPNSPFDYIAYDDIAQAAQGHARADAESLLALIRSLLDKELLKAVSTHKIIEIATQAQHAQKSLEETYMWIGKMIRNHQIIRKGAQPDVPERGEAKPVE